MVEGISMTLIVILVVYYVAPNCIVGFKFK